MLTGLTRAAVAGTGLMGRAIAAILAAAGLDVTLHDASAIVLGEAVALVTDEAARLRAGSGTAAAPRAGTVSAAGDLTAAAAGAGLVIEAVAEDLAVKQEVFAQLSAAAPAGALLVTNTSVLPVTAVAARARHPERVAGMHWWNPPSLIPIVEVVPGEQTSAETVQRAAAVAEGLGKIPVILRRDVPGFIGNRMQHALWREAVALVADGVCDAATVDLVARNTIGLRLARMGPLENADYVGLDLTIAIHDAVLPSLSTAAQADPLLRGLVAGGHPGARAGHGLLPWPPGAREAAARALAAHVSAQQPSGRARSYEDITPTPGRNDRR
jgi:3-hydroxybutyryl-CoA dehydrogenase